MLFFWCDDFFVVCNCVLELVVVDWYLVLDVDEWLIDGGDVLCGLCL